MWGIPCIREASALRQLTGNNVSPGPSQAVVSDSAISRKGREKLKSGIEGVV